QWKLFFADKAGVFEKDSQQFKITEIIKGERRLLSEKRSAVVVARLRYEYALNLMQKLNISMNRIGLDFSTSN
ncbi:hypothetical protein, partial [Sphingorhabdus sp.]